MTLLSAPAISCKVSFLPADVTREIGLVEGFLLVTLGRARLSSSAPVESRLAFRGVELHLLQSVVAVLPLCYVPLGLPIGPGRREVPFPFQLSFPDAVSIRTGISAIARKVFGLSPLAISSLTFSLNPW